MGLTAADMEFSEATAEQRQLSWKLCGHSWASPMSIDDYVEREQHMADHELNRDGGCQYWVLYLKGYPRQVIASCETTRKRMLISDGNGSPTREGHGYAIANVYTNPSYRRQGMAAFLLRRVQEQIDTNSDCSVLYSDSGRSYYAGLGWASFGSHQATLTLLPPSPSTSTQPPSYRSPSTPQTLPLQASHLPDLCQRDQAQLTRTFKAIPADDPKTRFAFLPTHGQISWHLARAAFDASRLFPGVVGTTDTTGTTTPSPVIGAITVDKSAWAYWAHDWRRKRLRVLRVVHDDGGTGTSRGVEEAFTALLAAAAVEARRWGFTKVVLWNPVEAVRVACKGVGNAQPEGVKVVFEDRVEGWVPSLRWNGARPVGGVAWEEHNGYCWC
jgi:GNAT superfamily N-acetyltransferase